MKAILLGIVLTTFWIFSTDCLAGWKFSAAPIKVVGGDENYYMQPVWSPDGSAFAFTGENYQGLWVMRIGQESPEKISEEPAVGFGFAWSHSGRAIVGRVAQYVGARRLNALKLFDLQTGQSRDLTDFRNRMLGLPRWSVNDAEIYCFDGRQIEVLKSGLAPASVRAELAMREVPYLQYGQIALVSAPAAVSTILDPLPGSRYINLVLSPDASKLAFEVVGGGLHVMSVDGTELIDLGRGHRPQWSPDGEYLVYMVAEDDGHVFTESDLFTIRADGTEKSQLTDRRFTLEMNPSWGPDGETLLFDTYGEGAIYRVELQKAESSQ